MTSDHAPKHRAGEAECPQRRVLLIERECPAEDSVAGALRRAAPGCAVHRCSALPEGLRWLASRAYGVLVLDLSLPGCRGGAVLAELRARAPDTAILLMAAERDAELALRAAQWDAEGCLLQSEFRTELLPRALRHARSLRRRLSALEAERSVRAHQATHDPLTGLPNRLLFSDRMERALVNNVRTGRRTAVLFVDLDHFKEVNDALGHAGGDAVLCEVARRLHAAFRDSDTVARLGGDEFAVLLTNLKRSEDALRLARALREQLSEPLDLAGRAVRPQLSIGVAVMPERPIRPADLLAAADAAMYSAKRAGRDQVSLWDLELGDASVGAGRRAALRSGEFELLYSPCVDAHDGAVRGLTVELGRLRPGSGSAGAAQGAEGEREAEGLAERTLDLLRERLRRDLRACAALRELERVRIRWAAAAFEQLPSAEGLAGLAAGRALQFELKLSDRLFFGPGSPAVGAGEPDGARRPAVCLDHRGALEFVGPRLRQGGFQTLCLDASKLGSLESGSVDEALLWGLAQALERLGVRWMVGGVRSAAQVERLCELGCRELQGPLFGTRLSVAALLARAQPGA